MPKRESLFLSNSVLAGMVWDALCRDFDRRLVFEEVDIDRDTGALDKDNLMDASIYLVMAVGLGTVVSTFLNYYITLPGYIGAMLVGAIIRNVQELRGVKVPMREISALGNICLSLFLGLAMINLKLWQLVSLALPMIVILLIQTVIVYFYASYVVLTSWGGIMMQPILLPVSVDSEWALRRTR